MADYSREELHAMYHRSNTLPDSSGYPPPPPLPPPGGLLSPSGSSQSSNNRRDFDSGSSPRSLQDLASPRAVIQEYSKNSAAGVLYGSPDTGKTTSGSSVSSSSNPHEDFVRKKSPSAKLKEKSKAKQQQQQQAALKSPPPITSSHPGLGKQCFYVLVIMILRKYECN